MVTQGAAFPPGYRVNKGRILNKEEFFVTAYSFGFFAHSQNLLALSQVNRISVMVLNALEKEIEADEARGVFVRREVHYLLDHIELTQETLM